MRADELLKGGRRAAVAALLGWALLAGCGGGGGGAAPALQSLTLSYYYKADSGVLPVTATVGDRFQLLAYGVPVTGSPVPVTNKVAWHSSAPAVASVSAAGLLQAGGVGATDITATYQGLTSDTIHVQVNARGATPTANYYPFSASSYWAYQGTTVTPGSVRTLLATPTLTILVHNQVVLEGLVWWELEIKGTDPKQPSGWMYLRHDDQGLRQISYAVVGGSSVPQYTYKLREPLLAGSHWADPYRSEHSWDLTSITASVTVPAGTYTNCFKVVEHDVDATGVAFDTTAWFAPGVGVVRTETTTKDPITGNPVLESEQSLQQVQFGAP
ncbi:MAG TPA: Ig-like domain-containing protein [Armatimonadota bacterium]|jgi:hypothetical protein